MKIILRKCSTGDTLCLRRAKVLCRRSQKLAFLAPYAGQWVFYSLTAPKSKQLRYNHLPAPLRCRVEVGDLLELKGLELIVDSIEVNPGTYHIEMGDPSPCAIEAPGKNSVQVTHDLLIGYDPYGGLCLASTLDLQPPTALLTFVAGHWHLHDLNGNFLIRNGKSAGPSLVLADGDRVRIYDKELHFHIGESANAVPSLVLPDGDRVRIYDNELRIHIGESANAGRETEPHRQANKPDEMNKPPTACRETVEMATPSTQKIDPVYRQAKELCQQLCPVLREPGRKLQPLEASCGGIKDWLRIFRRPSSPAETLERLQFLLSGSPRDRVWLFELAHFLFQQSYHSLCLRVLKELGRLYPRDVTVVQTLAKFYYQQARNPRLPASGRLHAFAHAERCTQHGRRLAPNDPVLADLEQAISVEQTILTNSLAEKAPSPEGTEAMRRRG